MTLQICRATEVRVRIYLSATRIEDIVYERIQARLPHLAVSLHIPRRIEQGMWLTPFKSAVLEKMNRGIAARRPHIWISFKIPSSVKQGMRTAALLPTERHVMLQRIELRRRDVGVPVARYQAASNNGCGDRPSKPP